MEKQCIIKNLTATEVDERFKNYQGSLPGDSLLKELIDKYYGLLEHSVY